MSFSATVCNGSGNARDLHGNHEVNGVDSTERLGGSAVTKPERAKLGPAILRRPYSGDAGDCEGRSDELRKIRARPHCEAAKVLLRPFPV